jgi:hypothetical protein
VRRGPTRRGRCGCSSGVEHNLAKVGVGGSNPLARSNILNGLQPNSRQPAKLGKQGGSNETEFGSLEPSGKQAFGLPDARTSVLSLDLFIISIT